MSDMLRDVERMEAAFTEAMGKARSLEDVERLRLEYLGKLLPAQVLVLAPRGTVAEGYDCCLKFMFGKIGMYIRLHGSIVFLVFSTSFMPLIAISLSTALHIS